MRFKIKVGRDFDSGLELQVELDPPRRSWVLVWAGAVVSLVALTVSGLALYGVASGDFSPLTSVVKLVSDGLGAILQLGKG
jgi:hypothetical protein